MRYAEMSSGEGRFKVEALVVATPHGSSLTICTPEHALVGATALAQPRASLRDPSATSATVSVLSAVSREDDIPARRIAKRIASETHAPCSVTCGLYVEQASYEDIEAIQANVDVLGDLAVAFILENTDDEG